MKHFFTTLIVVAVMAVAGMIFVHTFAEAVVYSPDGFAPPPLTEALAKATALVSPSAPSSAKATAPKPAAKPPASYPAKLAIPALGVNAAVQETTLTARGTIGTPTNFTDVAWYMDSAVPGKTGASIIDGHVDNGLGLAGVFKNLSDVKAGDDIYVTTYGGTKVHFVVTDVSTYDYQNVPLSSIMGQDDASRLVLITCEGQWVPGDKTYDQRLIVTASKA